MMRRILLLVAYFVAAAAALYWAYSLPVMRACVVVAPSGCGVSPEPYDCAMMGAGLSCSPSLYWYLSLVSLIVVGVGLLILAMRRSVKRT